MCIFVFVLKLYLTWLFVFSARWTLLIFVVVIPVTFLLIVFIVVFGLVLPGGPFMTVIVLVRFGLRRVLFVVKSTKTRVTVVLTFSLLFVLLAVLRRGQNELMANLLVNFLFRRMKLKWRLFQPRGAKPLSLKGRVVPILFVTLLMRLSLRFLVSVSIVIISFPFLRLKIL